MADKMNKIKFLSDLKVPHIDTDNMVVHGDLTVKGTTITENQTSNVIEGAINVINTNSTESQATLMGQVILTGCQSVPLGTFEFPEDMESFLDEFCDGEDVHFSSFGGIGYHEEFPSNIYYVGSLVFYANHTIQADDKILYENGFWNNSGHRKMVFEEEVYSRDGGLTFKQYNLLKRYQTSGIVPDTLEAYGILYDSVEESIRLGRGKWFLTDSINETHSFEFFKNEGESIAVRDLHTEDDGSLVMWDAEKYCLVKAPLEKGIGDSSIQQSTTLAGSKGYYIETIDKANSKIYLLNASTQPYTSTTSPKTGAGSVNSSIVLPYEIGNTFSIVNNNKYYLCGKITAINKNVVTYESLVPKTMSYDPFTVVQVSNPDQEDYSFIVIEHPEAGVASIKSNSLSIGIDSITVGRAAESFGRDNITFGDFGFAEGRENEAGYNAHAEGRDNRAYGGFSHAEGRSNTVGNKDYPADMWEAQYSHAEGAYNTVRAKFAHAEGQSNTVTGENAHVEGRENVVKGLSSHGEGYRTLTEGERAHAEGSLTTARGLASHIEGTSSNLTSDLFNGTESVEAIQNKWNSTKFAISAGQASHVEGNNNAAYAKNTHAEGNCNVVTAENSHVEGSDNNVKATASHAEGASNVIESGAYNSHVEGNLNIVKKWNSHAEGYKTRALNERCHTEGSQTTAAGVVSHIEGTSSNIAADILSETIITGSDTEAIISKWNASRNFSLAKGQGSHVQNNNGLAIGKNSSVAGDRNIATGEAQFVVGKYNKRNDAALFIVGNGTSATAPSNILEVTSDKIIAHKPIQGSIESANHAHRADIADEAYNVVPLGEDGSVNIDAGFIGGDVNITSAAGTVKINGANGVLINGKTVENTKVKNAEAADVTGTARNVQGTTSSPEVNIISGGDGNINITASPDEGSGYIALTAPRGAIGAYAHNGDIDLHSYTGDITLYTPNGDVYYKEQKLSDYVFPRMGRGVEVCGSNDLNNCVIAGIYAFNDSTLNTPCSYGHMIVTVSEGIEHNDESNWVNQLVFGTNNIVYYREKVNGINWHSWNTLITNNSIVVQKAGSAFQADADGDGNNIAATYMKKSFNVTVDGDTVTFS